MEYSRDLMFQELELIESKLDECIIMIESEDPNNIDLELKEEVISLKLTYDNIIKKLKK